MQVKKTEATQQDLEIKPDDQGTSLFSSVLELGTSIADGAITVGQTIGGKALSGVQDAASGTCDLATNVVSGAQEVSSVVFDTSFKQLQASTSVVAGLAQNTMSMSADATGKAYEAMLNSVVATAELSMTSINYTLDKISGTPGEQANFSTTATRLAIGLLPMVGELQAYGDARNLYREAQLQMDEQIKAEMIQEAKRDCLVLCTQVSFQLAALPTSGPAQFGLNVAKSVISVADGIKSIASIFSPLNNVATSASTELINRNADTALENEIVNGAVQWLLEVEFKDKPVPN